MKESTNSPYEERDSHGLEAQFTALSEHGAQLLASYGAMASEFLQLLKVKLKANLKVVFTILILIIAATVLSSLVWVSLHILIVHALVSSGLSWFVSAGLVMVFNILIIYYLLVTAIRLFDKASSDVLDDFFNLN